MPRCAKCGAIYSAGASKCPECGTETRDLSDIDQLIDDKLAAVENRLEKAIPDDDAADSRNLENQQAATLPETDDKLVQDTIITLDSSDVSDLARLVFESNHVVGNPEYHARVRETRFRYEDSNPVFDAHSEASPIGPRIVVSRGCIQEFGIFALLFSGNKAGEDSDLVEHARFRIARVSEDDETELPEMPEIENEQVIEWGRELLGSMIMYVIAHELGHIVYGHIYGPGYDGQPIDVSRNQERDADSFASSVIASSRFRPFLLQGQLAALFVLAIHELEAGSDTEPGTHPLALERLLNAIRSNSEAAEELGITDELVSEFSKESED